jgi:hypothetical protein
MRFYQGLLPAIVWDKVVGAPKWEFKNGVFDTDDENLINELLDYGYLTREDVAILEAGGTLPHGGFEPQPPIDSQLPSGRPPMDDPDAAMNQPGYRRFPGAVGAVTQPNPRQARQHLGDNLPASEEQDLRNVVRSQRIKSGEVEKGVVKPIEGEPDKRPRVKKTDVKESTVKTAPAKKSSSKKTESTKKTSASTSKKRSIKRRRSSSSKAK